MNSTANTLSTRAAKLADVDAIYEWIFLQADSAKLLPLSKKELKEKINNFVVLESYNNEQETKQAIGCGALDIYNQDLAELRTIVIDQAHQQKGGGKILIQAIETKAQQLAIKRLIALTYVPAFFHKLGYSTVDRATLPEKIWRVCFRCPKFFLCDEVAVIKDIARKAC